MSRVLLTVEYDGGDFAGWQRQAPGRGLAVQQVVEEAIRRATKVSLTVHGAGRTDAGVHAQGQRCHFDLDLPLPIERLPQIINAWLPRTVRITAAQEVAPDFHARIHAIGKLYRYVIEQQAPPSAFGGRYTWQIPQLLDGKAMAAAARLLVGTHDFRHYTLAGASAVNFTRAITRLEVSQGESLPSDLAWRRLTQPLIIEAEGGGFLYKMVRIIAGRLVAVGQGRIPVSAMTAFLTGQLRMNIPPAPARGLTLAAVYYPESELANGTAPSSLFC